MFVSESPAQPADRPPEDLPLEHLEHQICQLAAQLTASTARWLALVGEFDRRDGWWSCPGIRSMVEWVCGAARSRRGPPVSRFAWRGPCRSFPGSARPSSPVS